MKKEKSCGAVLYYIENDIILYLVIQYQLNHHYWGFVKGHIEPGETELQTAKREIMEEVGLEELSFHQDFRCFHSYQSSIDTNKKVVFFLAQSSTKIVSCDSNEVKDSIWLPFQEACMKITYENDRDLLAKANAYLIKAV